MNTEFTVYYQGLENLQTSFTASGLQARARLDKTGQFIIIIFILTSGHSSRETRER